MPVNARRKASSGNRFGMAVVAVVVAVLIISLLIRSSSLDRKIEGYNASNAALEDQIKEEKDRAAELEKLPGYVRSDEYIEKMAREKFGLVYDDETVFKPE